MRCVSAPIWRPPSCQVRWLLLPPGCRGLMAIVSGVVFRAERSLASASCALVRGSVRIEIFSHAGFRIVVGASVRRIVL